MKGIYSQGIALLTDQFVAIDELRPLLPDHPFIRTVPAGDHWEFGGETAVIAYRPEVNGYATIDSVDRPWPDHMGNTKNETMLFGAWSMGHFGPFAFPNGLSRSIQQAWNWPEAKDVVPNHTAFIRLRMSYTLGAKPNDIVLPPDYEPRAELDFLNQISRSLLKHPYALCLFNPNGETVMPLSILDSELRFCAEHDLTPLTAWTNVRLYNINPEWLMMDTIGNWQLDIADHEAVFPADMFKSVEVSSFLRNATNYVQTNGAAINDGDTMDGPGGVRWQAITYENGLTDPPREVISWLPTNAPNPPEVVTNRKRINGPKESIPKQPQKRWWPFSRKM